MILFDENPIFIGNGSRNLKESEVAGPNMNAPRDVF
jgi:hypothetical protein